MTLICGPAKFEVEKVNLYAKLNLFSGNPALLAGSEYRVRSAVSPSVFCDFVSWVEGGEATITSATLNGLAQLSEEFGFAALSAACQTFSESHTGTSTGDGQGSTAIARDVARLREAQRSEEREVQVLRYEVESLRSALLEAKAAAASFLSSSETIQREISSLKRDVLLLRQSSEAASEGVSNVMGQVESLSERCDVAVRSVSKLDQRVDLVEASAARLRDEVEELKRRAETASDLEKLKRDFEAEEICRRFCERGYGVHGWPKIGFLSLKYLKAAADLGHSNAQARYAERRNWAFFRTQDN
jgi:regulator of replication initiation timing